MGSNDQLSFTNLANDETIYDFEINPNSSNSWIVSPLQWGSSTQFMPMPQRADIKIDGYVRDDQSTVGDLLDYSLRIDRVIFGTEGDDTLVGDNQSGYIDARSGHDVVTGSAMDE
jgi:hypothetical protein